MLILELWAPVIFFPYCKTDISTEVLIPAAEAGMSQTGAVVSGPVPQKSTSVISACKSSTSEARTSLITTGSFLICLS